MISVVIPAYNEEENIIAAKEAVFAALENEDFELLFVDDGSKDLTWQKITEVSCENVRGLRFSRNFGKEAAIRAGLENCAGECAVVMDCDLQHPPTAIPKMIEKWRAGAEVVEGKKSARGKEARSYGFLANIFNRMMSRATGFDMSDASDFMLLDRRAVDAVLSYGEQGSFFRAIAQFVGFESAEVRYEVAARERGTGKWTFKKLLVYALKNIASFTDIPLILSAFLGAAAMLIAAVLAVLKVFGISLESFTGGILTLVFLGGLILLCLGITGFYLARIYDEIKHRPRYIISADTRKGTENER